MRYVLLLAAALLNLGWLCFAPRIPLPLQLAIPAVSVLLAFPAARRRPRRALTALLVYYLCILVLILFFGGIFHLERGWGSSVQLTPFYTIRNYLIFYRRTGSFISIYNLLGNFLLFLPFGILVPIRFEKLRKVWIFLPLTAILICLVEYIQWRTGTGAADIDDFLLNLAGAALGYFAAHSLRPPPHPNHAEGG